MNGRTTSVRPPRSRWPTAKRRGHLAEHGRRRRQLGRLEDERANGVLVRPAGDDLDHASSDAEACVVVTPDAPRRRELGDVAHAGDEIRERVHAVIGYGQLAFPSRRVREQIQHRHVAAGRFVGDAEVRQIALHRSVQIDQPLRGQAHDRRRGHRL